jgi:hypothetical protein
VKLLLCIFCRAIELLSYLQSDVELCCEAAAVFITQLLYTRPTYIYSCVLCYPSPPLPPTVVDLYVFFGISYTSAEFFVPWFMPGVRCPVSIFTWT